MKIRILLIFFLICLQLIFSRPFKIIGLETKPNRWYDKHDKLQGIDIDIIQTVMKRLNISYEITLVKSSNRLINEWTREHPKYDMILTYSKKENPQHRRNRYLYYASEAHINISWNFFCRKDDLNKINFQNYSDLSHLTVGVTNGISYTNDFLKALKNNTFRKVEYCNVNELQINKLLKKRFDIVPLNTQATLYNLKNQKLSNKVSFLPKPLKEEDYYNTFIKKSEYPDLDEIVKKYDLALQSMKMDGTLKAIFKKYGDERNKILNKGKK